MKKKLLIILLLPIIVLGLCGCGKEEEKQISLTDPVFGYETVFKYGKDFDFTDIKKEEGGASKSITFKEENLDVEFQMYYTKMMKKNYDITKETRSKQKYYKEYKFGKYKAYSYGDYTSGVYLNILINVDKTETAKVLFVAIDRIDANEEVAVNKVLDKELVKFFNTMEVFDVDQ